MRKTIVSFFMFNLISTVWADAAIAATKFNTKYTDHSGVEWSQNIGTYTNGCVELYTCNGTIVSAQDSAAEAACEATGGRLPSIREYYRLLREFDLDFDTESYGPELSSDGIDQITKIFNDMNDGDDWTVGRFWTSDTHPAWKDRAAYFARYAIPYTDVRSQSYHVRCVRGVDRCSSITVCDTVNVFDSQTKAFLGCKCYSRPPWIEDPMDGIIMQP